MSMRMWISLITSICWLARRPPSPSSSMPYAAQPRFSALHASALAERLVPARHAPPFPLSDGLYRLLHTCT